MIKTLFAVAAIFVLFILGIIHADVEKTEVIEKTYQFKDTQAENLLIVDNVWGDIRVTGYNGDNIRVKAARSISARTERILAEIEEEVYLDITEKDDMIELYVDGPFRDYDGSSRRRGKRRHIHYEARYDFEIEVPRGTWVELSTVNDGEILVRDIDGDYDVHNVNGGIEMERIGGSGEVYAVNGDVTVDFVKNPSKNSRFGSLNGDVRLHFLPKLSADFYLKTFNGEIYSDFPVSYLPIQSETSSSKNGSRYVYKVNRETAVRAGDGGPEIELDGFNGDMFILKK
ncbi:MAG: hypothetical protein JSV84_11945 [Gemmatimonadota bacterium]|nr:MAG: hypothetical protein JSV84_11945 [Gemmatimonadota bacterium]